MLLHEAKCRATYIHSGKSRQNVVTSSFRSILRREHLDVRVYFNLLDAQLNNASIYTTKTKRYHTRSSTNRIWNDQSRMLNVTTYIHIGGRAVHWERSNRKW
jgi:hypothetical protein